MTVYKYKERIKELAIALLEKAIDYLEYGPEDAPPPSHFSKAGAEYDRQLSPAYDDAGDATSLELDLTRLRDGLDACDNACCPSCRQFVYRELN